MHLEMGSQVWVCAFLLIASCLACFGRIYFSNRSMLCNALMIGPADQCAFRRHP